MTLHSNHIPSLSSHHPSHRDDELVFLPLGGTGEIGMNLSLYGYRGKWLIVDCGITFADETLPGIDILMPDPTFIAERSDALVGIVATHAHEDHIGAIPHLWPRLRCPVYATPFTASILRAKLAEAGLLKEVKIIEVPLSGHFDIAPFALQFITMTHSIPEPNSLVIRTPAATVFHTGDWKFDPVPLLGQPTDFDALRHLGDEGVDVLIGDSTNALRPGVAGSEADVRQSLIELVGKCRQRAVIACFASNVARLESAALAGLAHGRSPALVGRSLWRMEQAARENGYLEGIPAFLDDEDASELPPDKVLMICTGSQGEPRAALTRIAEGSHQNVTLDKGDTVIFSSRVIPGNDRAIGKLQNALIRGGVEVITSADHFVHVSGHPARDELTRLFQTVRPKLAIPVHGEARHLMAHAELATACDVPDTIIAENGDIVRLGPGPAAIIDHVETGRLALDGKKLAAVSTDAIRDRQRMQVNGSIIATLVLDRRGNLLAPPQVSMHGLPNDTVSQNAAAGDVERAINNMTSPSRSDDGSVREAVKTALRRVIKNSQGKRPLTDVHVVRI